MHKKKILLVSYSFYPRISPRSFRTTELAKEFSKQGHEVTILTHTRGHKLDQFTAKHNIKVEDFVQNKIIELPGKHFVSKVLNYFLRYFFIFPEIQIIPLLKKALLHKKGYDMLISIAVPYPIHWGVALALRKNKNLCQTWVADCGDPFMGNKELKFKHPFYFHFIENWFCTLPDYITVPIPNARDSYPKICRQKIKIIPQGFEFEIKNPGENTYSANPIPTFAYAGLLSKNLRDPRPVLEYLCTLKEKEFKFIVYTQNKNLLVNFQERLGDKLEIRDYIPREELLHHLSKMTFLLNFENKNNVQSPSKLIDYAIIGRPILSINSNQFHPEVFEEFLNGKFDHQLKIEDLDRYKIYNVTKQFLSLSK